MIRASIPFDVVRYAVLGGPAPGNRAYPLGALGNEELSQMSKRDALGVTVSLQRKGTCSLTEAHGRYVPNIVAARPRANRRSWDISHLLIDSQDDPRCENVLTVLFREVSQRKGERVFLRLRADDPLVGIVAHCGFTKYGDETLFVGSRKAFTGNPPQFVSRMKQADQHDVFRLYNASTPTRTRLALGMTLDQWRASLEVAGWMNREYVYRQDDVVRGWIQTTQRGRSGILTLMNHPDADSCVAALVQHGMSRMWGANTVYCLVQDHQVRLDSLLRQHDFDEAGQYVTMMRSIASPMTIKEPSRAVRLAGVGPTVDLSERWQRAKMEELVDTRSS